ncbi:DUF1707 and DUF4190 domain-containing protein [Actinacidiphila sp. ITFR-21]|uniref:DUF1707 and DUF4190 domain-containing protein n=1 Tax=Actinacidiphila sp. ITFR-21 TaxID=3075199 RepID=UPI002889A72F|nr:DUF1707 and DUF4190 domain-containing protein [Streptomyces sp. ITFR-21]WNI17258.1 DUF1707 and DUF4190 domain-containing protein [Streptomyces sp. ITFR-21]
MLAGDADRERAVRVLKDAFTEGRLALEEYEDRVGHAYQARTYRQLDVLTGDIPRPVPPAGTGRPAPGAALSGYPPPPRKTNGKAVGSLVASLGGSFCCGVGSATGVVLGHLARREIAANGYRGDGLATGGLVIGYLGLAFWILVFVLGASGG